MKSFIATCGTTLEGEPHAKKKWRNNNDGSTDYFSENVPRPQMAAEYFQGAQVIDVHNHMRQGKLALEKRPVRRWATRFFQTFVGICTVDACNAFKLFTDHDDSFDQKKFVKALAWKLLNNRRGGAEHVLSSRVHDADQAGSPGSPSAHKISTLRLSALYLARKLRAEQAEEAVRPLILRCSMCHQRTSTYCVSCSRDSPDANPRELCAICAPHGSHARTCWTAHVAEAVPAAPAGANDADAVLDVGGARAPAVAAEAGANDANAVDVGGARAPPRTPDARRGVDARRNRWTLSDSDSPDNDDSL